MRRLVAALFLLGGTVYLAFKAEYLAMDGVEPWLQGFIVSPGAGLLAAAGFAAFPDTRRRVGACLLSVGIVAALACVMQRRASDGWTFYTPYASLLSGGPRPSMVLVGWAALTLGVGATTTLRRSLWGGILIGLALWSLACFSPSEQLWARHMEDMAIGMPRRYRYYYIASGTLPGPHRALDLFLPTILAGSGTFVLARSRRR